MWWTYRLAYTWPAIPGGPMYLAEAISKFK